MVAATARFLVYKLTTSLAKVLSEVTVKKHKAYKIAFRLKELLGSWIVFVIGLYIFFLAFINLPLSDEGVSNDYYKVISLWGSNNENIEVQKALFSIKYMHPKLIEKTAENQIKNKELKEALINISIDKKDAKSKSLRYFFWHFTPVMIIFFGLRWYFNTIINYNEHKSYIIINRRSENEYNTDLAKKSKIEFYSVSFLIVTIITGILVNFLYDYFFK